MHMDLVIAVFLAIRCFDPRVKSKMTYRFERTVSGDDILATTEAAVPTNIEKVTKYGR